MEQRLHLQPTALYLCAALILAGCGGGKPVETPVAKKAVTPPKPAGPPPPRYQKPENVRGIYVTAWSAGGTKKMNQLIDLLRKTELNSMVIDIRDDGNNYFKMGIPLSDESGATKVAVVNTAKLMDRLEKGGVYPIARIACFRDAFVPKKHPELAVNLKSGGVWKDRSGHTWLDPYNKKNWEYIGQIVDYALELRFPEIQLDYVRFPSEGKADTQAFPGKKTYPDPKATPTQVVAAFAEFIKERVHKKGGVISADIFGIVSSSKSDQGIGQELNTVAAPFDLICPMVYPSHFAKGEYGIKDPNASPYAILKKSLEDYKKRVPNVKVRPWLQDFWGYNAEQIKAQIKAARETGYTEYLMWNASNKYVTAAYGGPDEEVPDTEKKPETPVKSGD